jgi:transposase
VNPATGESSALLAPTVNTDYMNIHLKLISEQMGEDRHAVLVLDQAGWHVAHALQVPQNITLLLLPPYSPELNPIERLWAYLKSHYLSNRTYLDYDDLFAACRDAWNQITNDDLASITHTDWITHLV